MDNSGINNPLKEPFSKLEVFLFENNLNIKTVITRYEDKICSINSGNGLQLTYDLFCLDDSPLGYLCSQVCTHQNYLDFLTARLAASRQEFVSLFRGGEDLESYNQINLALLEGKVFLKEIPLKMEIGFSEFTKKKLLNWRKLQDDLCWTCSKLVENSEWRRNVRQKMHENVYGCQNNLVN